MRVLAVSDMHGRLDNVLRALDESAADLLISCGDWGDPGEVDRSVLERIVSRVPVVSVYGNHDDIDMLARVANADGSPMLLANGEVRDAGGLRLAGISGIWAKSHRKPFYITDDEVNEIAQSLAGRGVDVLITHGCPVGIADVVPGGRHGGQKCFLDALDTVRPRLYLCGHLHKAQSRQMTDGRLVVNIGHTSSGDYWTFDITHEGIVSERHVLAAQVP